MHRYRLLSPRREALGKLLGAGPKTFYALFKRYKIPEPESNSTHGNWALLTTITDEDISYLADHVWAVLPPSSRYCSWALQPRTVLQLRAEVGEYATRRYDPRLCKLVDVTDYCFEVIFDYEPVKHFPLITPGFEREAALFFEKLLTRPELVQRWSKFPSCLPEALLPANLNLT